MEVCNILDGYWLKVFIKLLIDRQIQRGCVNEGIHSQTTTDKWIRVSADCVNV